MLAKSACPSFNLNPLRPNLSWKAPNPLQSRVVLHGRRREAPSRALRNGGPVAVRAGYNRTPLDTPGAYQLIDEETGEKFIVWGGADDDDTQIPSKAVLSWNPSLASSVSKNSEGSEERTATDVDSAPSTVGAKGGPRSFGRLKVQRVKALAKQHPRLKDGSREYDDEPTPGALGRSHSDLELDTRKKKPTAHRHEDKVPGADRLRAIRESILRSNTEEMDDCVNQDKPDKRRKNYATEDSVAGGSNAGFRGWDKGGTSRDFRSESMDPLKQHKKLSADSDFFSRKSFTDLGCSEYLIESLRKQLFVRPSHIQAKAFKPVIGGKSCILADQSGSGKTLAYLAPVIQRLREEEIQGVSKSLPRSPRAVILVPTAELASQVLNNCRAMSRFGVPFRSMVVTGGFKQRTQLENLEEGVDVLIATPGRFMYLIKEGFVEQTNLRSVVLDEVDILCKDEDFETALQSLINSSPVSTQYLFVTATLPVDIYNKLVEIFPDCEVIMGPGMHRTSPGLEEVLVDCSGEDGAEKTSESAFENKKSALIQIVEETTVPKTIIFCNRIETCRKVENALKRLDRKGARVRVLPFHAAVAQETRLANMKEFTTSQPRDGSLFLVCTDRASRGIDFAGVDHVVLFDFPRDPSEYVRRVGRTARGAGGRGKAFVFAVGKQVSLARKIMERNQKGHPLHDVPAAYELMS
ncbi:hypothetical protein CDL15_Pgr010627 [Punica granatum]|uniref:DEAD-box ATP-dependent RNA helicase 50 n=1 Tax=Punica granatum TaxID=22663 RepID=A0A218VRR9_PUNGR|nr:hypothetical protein CDL15_Pgr010627 [Punica granatum]